MSQPSAALRLVPSPTLDALPPPPAGRTGWPWTEQSQRLPEAAPDGRPWPRLSIVTPSYNQAGFLEATIRSVLLQGYPALEYVIVDGASTDESRSIIERYAGWLSYWVSEPDRGQSHAINKGLARCGGEVFNWLNSDDQLMPGALAEVATLRVATQAAMLVGRGVIVDAQSGRIRHDWAGRPPRHPLDFTRSNRVVVAQPSAFLDARLVRQVGGLREDLQCVLDWELYLRLTVLLRERLTTATTPALLSYALYHPHSKTSSHQADFQSEGLRVLRALGPQLPALERLRLAAYVRGVVTQRMVADVWTANHRWQYLGSLLVQRPDALWSRPYWGALRRLLVRAAQ
ncbi:MAG: glycosyltransferase [Chloroflexi bacterium]|nr:MAG: glycosyltransferase [Chloroflexota bacterium]